MEKIEPVIERERSERQDLKVTGNETRRRDTEIEESLCSASIERPNDRSLSAPSPCS